MMMKKKILYASPLGKYGKPFLEKIIRRFGHENFDYLILVFDDTTFPEEIFKHCEFIYDPAPLFPQVKKHLTPARCKPYEYIFFWMDDIDVLDFDPDQFLEFFKKNRFEVAQPSLSDNSIISHPVTRNQPELEGRYTDFVEEMAMVFTRNSWTKFWKMFHETENPWGWGYDILAYYYCHYMRIGIIDKCLVYHTRKGNYHSQGMLDMAAYLKKNSWYPAPRFESIHDFKKSESTNHFFLLFKILIFKMICFLKWQAKRFIYFIRGKKIR